MNNNSGFLNDNQPLSSAAETHKVYEKRIEEMQEKIQQLEIMLIETERRNRKDYEKEVGRLRKMLYQQSTAVQYPQSLSNNTSAQNLDCSSES